MREEALILAISALTVLGMLLRPLRLSEYWFALAGAGCVVAFGFLRPPQAIAAVLRGGNVYEFLVGMMLLAGLATREGLFDVLAAHALRAARGSAPRLLMIVYATGVVVTVVLSNDATAVVLTPAVLAATRRAGVAPLPYLFACAFVANAASFVLPISNPANLVVYGHEMPALRHWLAIYLLPSAGAILATWGMLRWVTARDLRDHRPATVEAPRLRPTGWLVAAGIAATALLLTLASARDMALGPPTLAAGVAVLALVALFGGKGTQGDSRGTIGPVLRDLSWGVLPLVAGLFVLVEGIFATGKLDDPLIQLRVLAADSPNLGAALAGGVLALGSNLVNNLPLGLFAGTVAQTGPLPPQVTAGMLIGVDLGPNLSVTGSLATLLWLVVLRRAGVEVGARQFLRTGALVMPPALIVALALLIWRPF